jgi:ABC-type transport system involved in multi-copper enzyme maturation permease subunit
MKYLAILKDSVREAMDTTVFYVTAGLSLLLILFVSSISFRPLSVSDDVNSITSTFNWAYGFSKAQGMAVPQFDHGEVRQLNPGAEPWKGDYEFSVWVTWPDENKKFQNMSPEMVHFILQQGFSSYLDHVKVKPETSADPKESRFLVTSQGTKVENLRGWKHEPSLFFGAVPLTFYHQPLGQEVYFIEDTLVNGFGAWIGILIGIVITAFFIPNMLRKGTADLLLVKPMRRSTLLICKYVGGLSFIFLNTVLVVVGIWLVLGLRSGIWAPGFLVTIFVMTFFFAILYAVSTLFGVLTRSPIAAILLTCLVWVILYAVGWGYDLLQGVRRAAEKGPEAVAAADNPDEIKPPGQEGPPGPVPVIPQWLYTTVDTLHFILPRTSDLNALTSRLIIKGVLLDDNPRLEKLEKTPITWGESLTVSGVFIALMLGLSCVWFATRDY